MQNYNLIHDIRDTEGDSPGIVEPVSVTELKLWMRLEGFNDDQDSTAEISFTTDDDILEECITSAREKIEKYTGLSLIPKEFRLLVTVLCPPFEIPKGPIGDVTAVYYYGDTDYSDNEIDDVEILGAEFKLYNSSGEYITIDYSAGYGRGDTPSLPKRLKHAIMAQATWDYERRGDEEDEGICKAARYKAGPFKRPDTWFG